MKTTKVVIALWFIMVFAAAGAVVYAITNDRPEVTPVEYGNTPANLKNSLGLKVILPNRISWEKYTHRYAYLLVSEEGAKLDGDLYLKQFPEDAVIKKSGGRGTGEEYLQIFTDHLPDPTSKDDACRERAKWLKVRK